MITSHHFTKSLLRNILTQMLEAWKHICIRYRILITFIWYIIAWTANLAILIQAMVPWLFQMHYHGSRDAHPMHFYLKCFGNRMIKRKNPLILIDIKSLWLSIHYKYIHLVHYSIHWHNSNMEYIENNPDLANLDHTSILQDLYIFPFQR